MKKTQILYALLLLTPVSFGQDLIAPQPVMSTTPAFTTSDQTTTTTTATTATGASALPVATVTRTEPDRNSPPDYCPSASAYNIPSGYRLAGISPSCQAVIIPMSNRFVAKDPDEAD